MKSGFLIVGIVLAVLTAAAGAQVAESRYQGSGFTILFPKGMTPVQVVEVNSANIPNASHRTETGLLITGTRRYSLERDDGSVFTVTVAKAAARKLDDSVAALNRCLRLGVENMLGDSNANSISEHYLDRNVSYLRGREVDGVIQLPSPARAQHYSMRVAVRGNEAFFLTVVGEEGKIAADDIERFFDSFQLK